MIHNEAVFNELGNRSYMGGMAVYKCPSNDFAGLGDGDPVLEQALQLSQEPLMSAATNTAPMDERYGAWDITGTGVAVPQSISPSSQQLLTTIEQSSKDQFSKPSQYTYHTPAGKFVGPLPTSGQADQNWQKTLVNVLDASVKAGAPAATAYLNYTTAQQALRNQAVRVPAGGTTLLVGRSSYTPWVIGGLVVAGLLVALTAFSAKKG